MKKEFDFKKAYKNFINSKNFLQNNDQKSESSYWKRFNSKDFSIEQKLYNVVLLMKMKTFVGTR